MALILLVLLLALILGGLAFVLYTSLVDSARSPGALAARLPRPRRRRHFAQPLVPIVVPMHAEFVT